VAKSKHSGAILTNQNDIHDKIKRRLNSGMLFFSLQYFVFPSYIKKKLKIKIYKTVILPVVLYGCETWSCTLRGEDVSCRKLHSDELHSLYSSPNVVRLIKSRGMRLAGHVASIGEDKSVYRVLVGRPERKRPLGVGR
jgi:hypothetical protein